MKIIAKILNRIPFTYYPYKRYMHKYQCIFVHIPKNAGSSIGLLLGDDGARKHAKWYDFKRANAYFYKKYHKFCVVREPFDRLYSAYKYCLAGGNLSTEDLALQQLIKDNSNSFNSFVENVLTADFLMLHHLFMPQYLFIYDTQFKCVMNTVLRFETLAQQWQHFAKQHNMPLNLPHINSTIANEKQHSITLLNENAIKKVTQLYANDFSLLGYPLQMSEK